MPNLRSSISRYLINNKVTITYFSVTVFSLILAAPAIAADCSIVIPEEWKNHFPFDLVYPIGSTFVPPGTCPTINFWGVDRPVCSIPQLTAVLKNVILARVAVRGLFEL